MKHVFALFLAALLLAGCAPSLDTEKDDSPALLRENMTIDELRSQLGGFKICTSYPSLGLPFYSVLNHAVATAVEEKGDHLIALDPGFDTSLQIRQIEDMLTEGIDVMILSPVSPVDIRPALDSLRQANVPIINVAQRVQDEDWVDYIVSSDADDAGKLCAEDALARRGSGRVLVLQDRYSTTQSAAVAAWDAVTSQALEPVGHLKLSGQPQDAAQQMAAFWQEHPFGADIVFAGSDAIAAEVVGVLQTNRAKPGAVLVYGIGGTPDAKHLVAGGWMAGTAVQSPGTIGAKAAEIVYYVLSGKQPPKENSVPVTLATPDNIAEYNLDSWD